MGIYQPRTKIECDPKLSVKENKNGFFSNRKEPNKGNLKIEPVSFCEGFFKFSRSGTDLHHISHNERRRIFYYFSIFVFLFLIKNGYILEAKMFIFKVCSNFLEFSYFTTFLKNSRNLNEDSISKFLKKKMNIILKFSEIFKKSIRFYIQGKFSVIHEKFNLMCSLLKKTNQIRKMKKKPLINLIFNEEKFTQKFDRNYKTNCKRSLSYSKYLKIPKYSCFLKVIKIRSKNAPLINCIDLSTNQKTLTIGYQNSIIQVLNFLKVKPHENSYYLKGHQFGIFCAKKMNFGKYIVSSSFGGELYLWSLKQKSLILKYQLPKQCIWDFSFTQNEKSFVSGGSLGYAAYWHIDRPFPVRLLIGHKSDINVVKLHPDSNFIGTGSDDYTVRLWDIRVKKSTGKLLTEGSVNSLDFSPNGDRLTITGRSRIVNTFDMRTLKNCFKIKEGVVKNKIDRLLYLDKDNFAYVKDMKILKIWDCKNLNPGNNFKMKIPKIFFPTKVSPNLDRIFQLKLNHKNKITIIGLHK